VRFTLFCRFAIFDKFTNSAAQFFDLIGCFCPCLLLKLDMLKLAVSNVRLT